MPRSSIAAVTTSFLLALLAMPVLSATATARVPSSLPGANLEPIRGMSYQPVPSDYQPCATCVYFDTDFLNPDFKELWSAAGRGRGDLRVMHDQLGVNLLHLYDWNPSRNHLPFMNEARKEGIGLAVPISNFFVRDDPNAAQDIEAIVREVYSDASGGESKRRRTRRPRCGRSPTSTRSPGSVPTRSPRRRPTSSPRSASSG